MPATNSPKTDVIPVRFTRQQRQQIDELVAAGFGPQADVIRTAINQMHYREIKKMNKPTMKRIASSKALWNEYVDPQRNDPELFDSLTVEQRINVQRELWPDEYDEELRTLAIEIAGIVLDGDDKDERDAIEGEIYDWLADGETVTLDADALAVEWEIYEATAAEA
jgi:Arc/MetJ-type ribon-helix-helix transcriptional regulator